MLCKKSGLNIDIMQLFVRLIIIPIMVGSYDFLFYYTIGLNDNTDGKLSSEDW